MRHYSFLQSTLELVIQNKQVALYLTNRMKIFIILITINRGNCYKN